MPASLDDKYYEEYIEKAKLCERMLIFDYDRFVKLYPFHDMLITRDEWYEEGLDIPIKDRVCEFTVEYDHEYIEMLKERVEIARKTLKEMSEL